MSEGYNLSRIFTDIVAAATDSRRAPESSPEARGWEDLGDRMSNFDHAVDDGTEELLRQGECYCGYAGWDFHGRVWFEAGLFRCHVNRYREHVATISAETLADIMRQCSDRYGDR